jgi:hypothetical protein
VNEKTPAQVLKRAEYLRAKIQKARHEIDGIPPTSTPTGLKQKGTGADKRIKFDVYQEAWPWNAYIV